MLADKTIPVTEQFELGHGYFAMRLRWPELAGEVKPGQFVMIGVPDIREMLIRRPFSVARVLPDANGEPECFDLLYKVMGRCTELMSRMRAGSEMAVLGPLGRGFWLPDAASPTHVVMVAGGIGNAPFPLTLQSDQIAGHKTTLIFGGRSKHDLTLLPWFEEHCDAVVTTTEDGTHGRRGRVTEPLIEMLDASHDEAILVLGCGPHPMLKAVGEICNERSVPCQLAIEETMACGFGVCLGCVVPKVDPKDEFDRYVRVCREGPVFDSREIVL